jgi:ribonuclease-3
MNIKENIYKTRSLEDGIFFDSIQTILGFSPKNLDHFRKHLSFHK